jgi:hypothetical protein
MKISVAVVSAILLASAFSLPAHAQAQLTVPGFGQVNVGQGSTQAPPPAYGQQRREGQYADERERCDRLDARSHELRETLERTPPGPGREGLEQRIRETHREREQCGR